jgi:hypothetical protein
MATLGTILLSPESGWQRYDDSYHSITYDGGTSTSSNAQFYNSTLSEASYPYTATYVRFNFYGTKIRLITWLASSFNTAMKVSIDGTIYSFSEAIATYISQGLAFEKTDLDLAIHYVVIYAVNATQWNLDAVDIDDTGYMMTYNTRIVADTFTGIVATPESNGAFQVRSVQGITEKVIASGSKKTLVVSGTVATPIKISTNKSSIAPGTIATPINPSTSRFFIAPGISTCSVVGKRQKVLSGFALSASQGTRAARQLQGLYLSSLKYSAEGAGDHIKFMVTPTFTYLSSAIQVNAKNNGSPTKMEFYVNSTLKQTYMEFLKDFSLDIPLSSLITGDNTCRIKYYYSDESQEYVDFIVAKEDKLRTTATRNMMNYAGGYDLTGGIARLVDENGEYFGASLVTSTGTIATTDETSIKLIHDLEIMQVNADCSNNALFLVSFDKRQTWHSYINSVWTVVDKTNISSQGMKNSVMAAITNLQWNNIFKKTQLDIMAYLQRNGSITVDKSRDTLTITYSWTASAYSGLTYTIPDGYRLRSFTVNKISSGYISLWYNNTAMSGTSDYYVGAGSYGDNVVLADNINPTTITIAENPGKGVMTLVFVVIPIYGYIKSLNVTLSPKLNSGYAFIM